MKVPARHLQALTVAIGAHALLWLALTQLDGKARAPASRVVVELRGVRAPVPAVPTDPSPTWGTLVDDAAAKPPPARAQRAPVRAAAPSPVAAATSRDTAQDAEGPARMPRASSPSDGSLLARVVAGTMPEGVRPSLAALERAAAPEPSIRGAPAAPGGTGRGGALDALVALPSGGYAYETGGFSARIHADGSVTFQERLIGEAGALPLDWLNAKDKRVARYLVVPPGSAGVELARQHAHLDNKRPDADFDASQFRISADPNAVAMRLAGEDPYESERICFLNDTRELRTDLRRAFEAQRLTEVVAQTRARLLGRGTRAERQRAVFALWDECNEDDIGARAQQLVEETLRSLAPEGSPEAWTPGEVLAFDSARTSSRHFDPYRHAGP